MQRDTFFNLSSWIETDKVFNRFHLSHRLPLPHRRPCRYFNLWKCSSGILTTLQCYFTSINKTPPWACIRWACYRKECYVKNQGGLFREMIYVVDQKFMWSVCHENLSNKRGEFAGTSATRKQKIFIFTFLETKRNQLPKIESVKEVNFIQHSQRKIEIPIKICFQLSRP